ncbi:uncharacterized protein EAE97_003748 [Botrytis byssoidea]|uniref:Uncharacterized protein n=1 Tax=Botrytis byssoidea TaxID=139641 RepID=A0A9P5INL8_9HELO|nr:uncharacterized protein EAE97_003748 [Botrytis byssoidea]KAF7948337.1 hypothetical protein EAE97_003748 [Botrytis byssoidea]
MWKEVLKGRRGIEAGVEVAVRMGQTYLDAKRWIFPRLIFNGMVVWGSDEILKGGHYVRGGTKFFVDSMVHRVVVDN